MRDSISQMTPLLPEQADDLQNLALEVVQHSASLGTRQHPVTLHTLRELLRIINSYYTNLIEGHNTKLVAAAAAHHRLMWIHRSLMATAGWPAYSPKPIFTGFRSMVSVSGRPVAALPEGMPITKRHSPGPMRRAETTWTAEVT